MAKKRFKLLDLLLPREILVFKHLNEQVDIFLDSCVEFDRLISGIDTLSDLQRKKTIESIKQLEKRGDEKERRLVEELDEVFILPLDREDIHAIVLNIDNAIDSVHATSKMINTHNIRKKDKYLVAFSKLILESAKLLKKLVYSIEKRANSAELIVKIHKLENEADDLFDKCMVGLFRSKDPMEVLMRKDIYEKMEDLTDEIDRIAKIIRGVLVKQG